MHCLATRKEHFCIRTVVKKRLHELYEVPIIFLLRPLINQLIHVIKEEDKILPILLQKVNQPLKLLLIRELLRLYRSHICTRVDANIVETTAAWETCFVDVEPA